MRTNIFIFKILNFLCVQFFFALSLPGQSISPATINSAGADYFTPTAIMNVSIGEVVYHTHANTDAIMNEGFQHPNLADFFQNITIPAGWSGISSFIIPGDSILDTLFAGFSADTLIISSFDSLYIKGLANNSLNFWTSNEGKRIKVNEEYTVKYYGERLKNTIIVIDSGWNILPVLSVCRVSCDTIQSLVGAGFEMILDVAGDHLYWPHKNIYTLTELAPGKAYYLKNSQQAAFGFPKCN